MENNLLFSIVVRAYNRAHIIEKTLQSAFKQTYSNYEVIVVDDGSTDNTIEILKSITHPKLRFIHTENSERSAARYRGIELAKGDYVCLLDSDDLLLPNHLQVGHDEIKKRGLPSAIHLNFEVRDIDGQLIRKVRSFRSTYIGKKKLVAGNPLSCNGMFLKQSFALNFKFNEDRNLTNAEDYLLWHEIASREPIYTVNTATSNLTSHSERSVKDYSLDSLNSSEQLLLKYAFDDLETDFFIGANKKGIESYCYIYSAIQFVESVDLSYDLRFFLNASGPTHQCIFERRILGIKKHAILNISRQLLNQ
jgi:glycosyltransferase involved in cell wall biosynthesis